MSNKIRSRVGKISSISSSSKPHRKTEGWTATEKDSSNSLPFEEDNEMESTDYGKKDLTEKRKRKRKEDVDVEEEDSLEEDTVEMETEEEQDSKGESSNGVAGSQIDLVKLSEEFRARRANKSAVLRDSYTTKVIAPMVEARLSASNQWEKMDAQMARRMEQLKTTLAPRQLDVSAYLSLGAKREFASQNVCSAYERCTGQLVPEILGLADDDLNSLQKRVGYVRKEKKKHFASTKKKMNAIQAEQKAITDSHDLLRNFNEIFRKYRPSPESDFGSKSKFETGGGFVSSTQERSIRPKNLGSTTNRVIRPTFHQIL